VRVNRGTTKVLRSIRFETIQIVSVKSKFQSSKSTLKFPVQVFLKLPPNYYYSLRSNGLCRYRCIARLVRSDYPTMWIAKTVVMFENQIILHWIEEWLLVRFKCQWKEGRNYRIIGRLKPIGTQKTQPQNFFLTFIGTTAKNNDLAKTFLACHWISVIWICKSEIICRRGLMVCLWWKSKNPLGGYLWPQFLSEFPGYPKGNHSGTIRISPWWRQRN